MQIESGYIDNYDSAHELPDGVLGFRDSFVGVSSNWGDIRFGRMLTPLYELIDWPYSILD